MLVEINTWLLIVKRHVKAPLLELLFYASWVLLRLVLYPYLIPVYCRMYIEDSALFGTHFNVLLLAPVLQTYLTGLNFWWTITMLRQLAARRGKGGSGGRPSSAAANVLVASSGMTGRGKEGPHAD